MNLKNYTSTTPMAQTLSHIEAYLASAGVTGISKQYENGAPVALFFYIEIAPNRFTIRLPARAKEVQEYLWVDYCSRTQRPRKTKEDFAEQAGRTAWAIQRDWVQVQISLIKLKQADFLEVFMGFLWDGKRSYFEMLEASKFKALPGITKTEE